MTCVATVLGGLGIPSPPTTFLVMKLVQGATLAERLRRGRVRVTEALELALQIAGGLEAAHEKGILHRDLNTSCRTPAVPPLRPAVRCYAPFEMSARAEVPPIASADDPRLAGMGREDVTGADQIAGMLAASPDERLDGLMNLLGFIEEARTALERSR